MIVHNVADGYLEVELEWAERTRLCNDLGLSHDGIVIVLVTILRSPLDRKILHAKFDEDSDDGSEQLDICDAGSCPG